MGALLLLSIDPEVGAEGGGVLTYGLDLSIDLGDFGFEVGFLKTGFFGKELTEKGVAEVDGINFQLVIEAGLAAERILQHFEGGARDASDIEISGDEAAIGECVFQGLDGG